MKKKIVRSIRLPMIVLLTAAVLLAGIAAAVFLIGGSSAVLLKEAAEAEADPVTAAEIPKERQDNYARFFNASVCSVLAGQTKENVLYSPVGLYLSLAQMAEAADEEEQERILELLGADSMEELRESAGQLWSMHNRKQEGLSEKVISSLWFDGEAETDASLIDDLAEQYHASSFQAGLGTWGTNRSVQSWLNEQTDDLFGTGTGIHIDTGTNLAAVSTVEYHSQWLAVMEDGGSGSFYGTAGKQRCDYMEGTTIVSDLFEKESFTALAIWTYSEQYVLIVLPKEGETVDGLIQSGELAEFLDGMWDWTCCRSGRANLRMPEVSVTSATNLGKKLAFSGEEAFPEEMGVYQLQHLEIDAKGIQPNTKDSVGMTGTGLDYFDFIVDRPFAFFVYHGENGLRHQIILAGIMNRIE